MRIKSLDKQSISGDSIISALTAFFLVTKVFRTFSGVTDRSGGVWNLVQIIFVLIGFFWIIKYFRSVSCENPIVIMISLDIYICLMALPRIELSVSGLFNYFMIPYAACVLVAFYAIGMRTKLNERALLYYAFYITIIIIIVDMIKFYSIGTRAWFLKLIDVADVYFPLGLLPFTVIYVKKKNSLLPMALLAVALVLTGKRAGILALIPMAIIIYLGETNDDNTNSNIKKIIVISIIGITMYFLAIYLDEYFNLGFLERLSRLKEDGGSGRAERWDRVLAALRDSEGISLLFGHGWGSVSELLGGHAHNDFLEIFYEFGLVSVILYISFFLSLVAKLSQMKRYRYRYTAHYVASLICSLFLSLFSFYLIKPTYITCGMLCYGFFLSDFRKYKNEIGEISKCQY